VHTAVQPLAESPPAAVFAIQAAEPCLHQEAATAAKSCTRWALQCTHVVHHLSRCSAYKHNITGSSLLLLHSPAAAAAASTITAAAKIILLFQLLISVHRASAASCSVETAAATAAAALLASTASTAAAVVLETLLQKVDKLFTNGSKLLPQAGRLATAASLLLPAVDLLVQVPEEVLLNESPMSHP